MDRLKKKSQLIIIVAAKMDWFPEMKDKADFLQALFMAFMAAMAFFAVVPFLAAYSNMPLLQIQ
jgi:NADH:ubiquinone oxidoreductase subunit H